jgi:hypothetical protein
MKSTRPCRACGNLFHPGRRSPINATAPPRHVSASDVDAFIMSLTENIAQWRCRPLELLAGIRQLQE